MKNDPFRYEIQLKGNDNSGRRKNSILPHLFPWQYGKKLNTGEDFLAMINAYKGWIYVTASKNATSVASVPLRLYVAKNQKGQRLKGYPTRAVEKKQEIFIRENKFLSNIPSVRKAVEFEEILDHPFLDLNRSVNPFMNNFDLGEMTQLYQELTGNAYWHILEDKLGVPREIWLIPPQNCKIVPHPKKFISGYKYIKGSDEIDLSEKSVIHFKMANPGSLYYGHAPYTAIADEFGLNTAINEYETAMFSNQGALSGVFETEQELGDHEFERLKIEIVQAFTGPKNTGKMPLLDHGLKYKPMGTTPKEMSYLGGRESIKESILNAYGQALGMYSKEANRANVDAAIYQYMMMTVRPRLLRSEEKINEKLIWRYDEKLFVAYDNCVPDDRDAALIQRIKHVQTGIDTLNETRIELGKKPYDERFNEPIIPVNYTVMDEILNRVLEGKGEGNIVEDPKKMRKLLNQ